MNHIQAIQFYEGDVPESDDLLYSDSQAYVTFNAIYFDGIENEQIKLQENKTLNPQFLLRHEEIYGENGVAFLLLQQMVQDLPHPAYHTTRVERLLDFEAMQEKQETIAFTSTSKGPFLTSYGDKKGIVLLEWIIPEEIPCIDFSNVLPHYAKCEEAEILLPPFVTLKIQAAPLSNQEKSILDHDGNPPVGKYRILCTGVDQTHPTLKEMNAQMLQDSIALYQQFSMSETLNPAYIKSYLACKEALRSQTKKQLIELLHQRKSS